MGIQKPSTSVSLISLISEEKSEKWQCKELQRPPNGSARTSAHDHDGSPWYAPSPNGSPASQTSAELQVHPHCQESTCSVPPTGDAWTDGCPWRSSTSTTGCACPGTGTADCLHVGSCSSTGTEADVG